MNNRTIARVFGEIADFLEIKGENAFKIRAYRSAADLIGSWPDDVAALDDRGLRGIPGIGKDLAAKVRELVSTGVCRFHQELLEEFPPTVLDLLRLQGVGPKTVAVLFSTLHVHTVDELAAAARAGRLRSLKGMGPRKEALILRAIEERRRDTGRHLLADTAAAAADLVAYLRASAPDTEFVPVGSLRRGCESCGDIDILALGGDRTCMERVVAYPRTERVLGQGETKASVRLQGGYQVDLRLVAPESRGAALQYFTGSKAHNIALRDRAISRGLKLNEYGLFRVDDDVRIAGEDEAGIYEALGFRYIEPELRENRGELAAAEAGTLPGLLRREQLRGDLHMHTTETDGRHDLEAMAAAAARLGHAYIAVTEHSKALAMARGLDERRALAHAARIRALSGRFDGLTLLAGIECDILPDGRLDLAEDCLAALDIVIASVHSHFSQDTAQMTDRVLRALECPYVDVLGHPTGRLLLRRDGLQLDVEAVITAAARANVALEINCQVDRLDLNDAYARFAAACGARMVISTDAHSTTELANLEWGVRMARRGWLEPAQVLNTRSLDHLLPALRRHGGRSTPASAGQGA